MCCLCLKINEGFVVLAVLNIISAVIYAAAILLFIVFFDNFLSISLIELYLILCFIGAVSTAVKIIRWRQSDDTVENRQLLVSILSFKMVWHALIYIVAMFTSYFVLKDINILLGRSQSSATGPILISEQPKPISYFFIGIGVTLFYLVESVLLICWRSSAKSYVYEKIVWDQDIMNHNTVEF